MYQKPRPVSDTLRNLRGLLFLGLFVLLALAPGHAWGALILLDNETFGSPTTAGDEIVIADLGDNRFVTAHPAHNPYLENVELRTWSVGRGGTITPLDTHPYLLNVGHTAAIAGLESLGADGFVLARRSAPDGVELTTWSVDAAGTIALVDTAPGDLPSEGRFEMALSGSGHLFVLFKGEFISGSLSLRRIDLGPGGVFLNNTLLDFIDESEDWAIATKGLSTVAVARTHGLQQYALEVFTHTNNQLVAVHSVDGPQFSAERIDIAYLGDGSLSLARHVPIGSIRVERWVQMWIPPGGTTLAKWGTALSSLPTLEFALARLGTAKSATPILDVDGTIHVLTWNPSVQGTPLVQVERQDGFQFDVTHLGTNMFVTAARISGVPLFRLELWVDTMP